MRPLNILHICDIPLEDRLNVKFHLFALQKYSQHRVFNLSYIGNFPDSIPLEDFDVIVIHFTVFLLDEFYLSAKTKERIRNFKGLKVQFIQDEYRRIHEVQDMIAHLGIDVLFNTCPEFDWQRVYPKAKLPNVRLEACLPGYVPEELLRQPVKKISERPIDVGYRTRKLAYSLGRGGYEKWKIGDMFLHHPKTQSLRCDIDWREHTRIYGKKWIGFLTSCRAMLGTEGGSTVYDFTGEVQKTIKAYCEQNPQASFEEVQGEFLQDLDKEHHMMITPRHFEAASLKVAMVMFESPFNGILKPFKHYIPLQRDFQNIRDVVERIRDEDYLQDLVDSVYEDIALNPKYSYKSFIERFDEVVSEEIENRGTKVVSQYKPLSSLTQNYIKARHITPQRIRRKINTKLQAHVPEWLGQKQIRYALYRLLG